PHLPQQAELGLHAHDRRVVAVRLDDRPTLQARRLPPGGADEELGEVERLLSEPARVVVVGEEAPELVAERRYAARLEADDGRAGADVVAERVEDLPQVALREAEHAVVVERPPAAEKLLRHRDRVARGLERLDRGARDLGVELVVERVGPEDHATALSS